MEKITGNGYLKGTETFTPLSGVCETFEAAQALVQDSRRQGWTEHRIQRLSPQKRTTGPGAYRVLVRRQVSIRRQIAEASSMRALAKLATAHGVTGAHKFRAKDRDRLESLILEAQGTA